MDAFINLLKNVDFADTSVETETVLTLSKFAEQYKCHYNRQGNLVAFVPERDLSGLSSEMQEMLRFVNGLIVDISTFEPVCVGFPRDREFDEVQPNQWLHDADTTGHIIASEYVDGSLLRAYWNGTKWCLATNGNPDAYTSYWISQRSFGELFNGCLRRIFSDQTIEFATSPLAMVLDKTCCYQFLLSDPSVHSEARKAFIYHIGTYSFVQHKYILRTTLPTIHHPRRHHFQSVSEAQKFIETNPNVLGLLLVNSENQSTMNPRVRMLTPRYNRIKQLLGNTPNLYQRYLEIVKEGLEDEFITTLPSMKYYASYVRKCLMAVSKAAFDAYVQKQMMKNYEMLVHFNLNPIIRDLHDLFKSRKADDSIPADQKRIRIQDVNKLVWGYHPKRQMFILRGMEYIKDGNTVTNKTTEE